MHVGHGRQAALGDAIARPVRSAGYAVTREFYYNDAGAQIQNLALSVRARAHELLGSHATFPEDGYRGDYIRELAQRYLDEVGHDLSDIESIRRFAVAELRKEQDRDLQAFGVQFDHYYLESSLYTDGRVDATVAQLAASGSTYEHEGALWLKTTGYGDDKDRVMRKSDGGYTYFVPDVAYHVTKCERGFAKAINVQGSDHHGTITRVRAGLQALGIGVPAGYPDYVLHKMVTVMRGGEEVKISKRAGSYVTLRDLIDEVGRDAVRFFLVVAQGRQRVRVRHRSWPARNRKRIPFTTCSTRTHACARCCGRRAFRSQTRRRCWPARTWRRSPVPTRMRSCDGIADFPSEVATAARDLAPHLITFYLKDLAQEFHSYYNAERFLVADEREKRARLALAVASGQVLRNGLAVLGIGAPGADVIPRVRERSTLMSRHDSSRNPRHARSKSSPQRARGSTLLGIFVGVIIGLGMAAAVAFWLMKNNPAFVPAQGAHGARGAKDATRSAKNDAPEKPRFDFYKILPGAEEARVTPERKAARQIRSRRCRSSQRPFGRQIRRGGARAAPATRWRASTRRRRPRSPASVLAADRIVLYRVRRREPEGAPCVRRLGGDGAAGRDAGQGRALPRPSRAVRQPGRDAADQVGVGQARFRGGSHQILNTSYPRRGTRVSASGPTAVMPGPRST